MQTPDLIEAALSRLMPPALSESGQRSIEAMLDELAAAAPAAARPRFKLSLVALAVPLGIAAALVAWFSLAPREVPAPVVATLAITPPVAVESASRLLLVREFGRVESVSDEGWMSDPDGEAMAAVRVRVVEANTFQDEDSGIVVQVSDPRDEVILTPVSVF
ncbi:MAG: hypothetical protein RLZZ522_1646 [Verrucomicrobiota bacterium]|jgi:hypothetical protein